MPTALRIIIFAVELVGFIIFSVVSIRKFYKRYKVKGYSNDKIKGKVRYDIKYFTINNMILICLFLFTYPSFVFLSYSKMLLLSIAVICSVLMVVGIGYLGDKWEKVSIIMHSIGLSVGIIYCTIAATGNIVIMDKTFIEQKETIETILPTMNLADKTKISVGYMEDDDGNIDKYFYYYQDSEGKWHFENDCKVDIKYLEENENSYLEKYVETKIFLSEEKRDSTITEEEITYTLFLNEKQLIKIETD